MKESFNEILTILDEGGIILFPTDTVWAIGCDATNAESVAKIKKIRNIEQNNNGLVTLVADIETLNSLVDIPPRLMTLLSYHTKPLTVIYSTIKTDMFPQNLCASDQSVALRVPHDPFCNQLLTNFGRPIVATIAAVGNTTPPTHFGLISSDILENMDYVVRYRQDEKNQNLPSVMVLLNDNNELIFLRN